MSQPQDQQHEIEARESAQGVRLEVFLCHAIEGMSRRAAKRLVHEGNVYSAGARLRAGYRIRGHERIVVKMPRGEGELCVSGPLLARPLLVFEDEHLVVIYKPAGVDSHGQASGRGSTAADDLLKRYPAMADWAEECGFGRMQAGLVHRLDFGTSGVLLAARTSTAFTSLRAAMAQERIKKHYLALCQGHVPHHQRYTWPIGVRKGRAKKVAVESDGHAARSLRSAESCVRFVQLSRSTSLCVLEAHRARRHQLRAHLAHAGYPIVGDALYGGPPHDHLVHHFLHAHGLRFEHPISKACISIIAGLPPSLQEVLRMEGHPEPDLRVLGAKLGVKDGDHQVAFVHPESRLRASAHLEQ